MESSPSHSNTAQSQNQQADEEEETQTALADTLNVLKQIKSYMNKRYAYAGLTGTYAIKQKIFLHF